MLERYFVRPTTVDRIRATWLGEPIERYVTWLSDNDYAARNVSVRVPLLVAFGEFAWSHGATALDQLPEQVEAFVADWVRHHSRWCQSDADRRCVANAVRGPVEQMLQLLDPDYAERVKPALPQPFVDQAPGFFAYLSQERGLKETTTAQYLHYLRRFERYLVHIGLQDARDLSAPVISAFITDSSTKLGVRSLQYLAGVLRVFLAFLYRQRLIDTDLSRTVEAPQHYRLADVPRSISWEYVKKDLDGVDTRSPVGKRDYALLLLMVVYGLRAREVAALTLDAIDWKRERLLIAERKAGHTTAYPLSQMVGEAIIDYLRLGRPKTDSRALFFRAVAPYLPLKWWAISQVAARHLRRAGVAVPRPGSHTLRHACVQRLVDAQFPLKAIGDYLGHRSPDATEVYTKVQIEALREVALGDGEAVL